MNYCGYAVCNEVMIRDFIMVFNIPLNLIQNSSVEFVGIFSLNVLIKFLGKSRKVPGGKKSNTPLGVYHSV
jgi:hypothetical protein